MKKQFHFISLVISIMLLLLTLSGCSQTTVKVSNPSNQLYPAAMELTLGKSVKLAFFQSSIKAEGNEIEWRSTNTGVVAVSQDGTVKGISEGEAVIEAVLIKDKKQKATCRIFVVQDGPTLLYGKDTGQNPLKPNDFNPNEHQENQDIVSEEAIPVEYDHELDIPVEQYKIQQEYLWVMDIKDTVKVNIETTLAPIEMIYKITAYGEKREWPQYSRGKYNGNLELEVIVNTGETMAKVNSSSNSIISFYNEIGGSFKSNSFSPNIIAYNQKDFDYFDGLNVMLAELTPKPVLSLFGMAYGYTPIEGAGYFNVSMKSQDGMSVGAGGQMADIQDAAYKMKVNPHGWIELHLLDLKTDKAFKGRIYKKTLFKIQISGGN
ncbi:Ig-like domain-containing protein [Alkaliphilus peptidifermentans]|uniref:Ig-like domain (Group 2) n=1 Tax=Alkaliphilus peptidifermentans DSM 18978 TaxID=1120976 RepID=A0A1G5IL96_9FIRM|nr:Ig-like domain-containing protein [Alkaliphilus peptidifermentans]SCY76694.1 Ig-like domain (group 2) [Alkaliphilus peptidifermentans DSM 18978]